MVDSISNIMANSTVSTTFVGLILFLIVGNAVKYITTVTVAYKDEISLAINIITKFSI
jgi:Ca2+/H+ antiporter